jgi:hypothetical protein
MNRISRMLQLDDEDFDTMLGDQQLFRDGKILEFFWHLSKPESVFQ